jgi:hypothetical protein
VAVSADSPGLVSQAGAVLLWETMRVTGLGAGLSRGLARWRAPRAVHDPGKIVADLAAAVALGGDCLADIAVLRDQPELAGPVASDPVVSRLVSVLAADLPRALKAVRAARSAARERAWALAAENAPGADKDQAAPTWKKTFGLSSDDRLGRPRRGRERRTPCDRAQSRERWVEHRRRPHRGDPAVPGPAAPAPAAPGLGPHRLRRAARMSS